MDNIENNNDNFEYKGGKLSEIVIAALRSFIAKIRVEGIKKSIHNFLPGIDPDSFILNKIKTQLRRRTGTELGAGLGRIDVQYRYDGIQIEPMGALRFIIKKITITDEQIIKTFDDILNQIEEKYITDDSYIIKKTDDIVFNLSGTEIYKPKTSEEKTLYDLATLILLNHYKRLNEMPAWADSALVNLGKGEFIEKWIGFLTEYITEVIAKVSENIFFDFKVTFDSVMVRAFLNKKTNRGQLSQLLKLFNINVKEIIYNFAKNYVSPSFIRGSSEILSDIASSFLSDVNKSSDESDSEDIYDFSEGPFNITVCPGKNPQSDRAFTWYSKKSDETSRIEYSYTSDFASFEKVYSVSTKVPRAVPVMNLGLITSYKITHLKRHLAYLRDLKPGTLYYRLVCGEDLKSETFKLEIKEKSSNFEFLVFADSQGMVRYDYEVFAKVFRGALKNNTKTDFAVHLGDFVDDGNNEEYWKWVLDGREWAENMVVPLSGNHDARMNAAALKAGVENSVTGHFSITNFPPQDTSRGVYYSFVYGGALFIVLNTNTAADEEGLDKTQYKWALDTARNSKEKWKILFTHKTPYSDGPHHKDADVKVISKQIIELAYQGEIDLVMGGHDHVYCRTPFLTRGRVYETKTLNSKQDGRTHKIHLNPVGTIFVVPGTSGVKNYKPGDKIKYPTEVSLELNRPVYSKVKINGDSLQFGAYAFDEQTETSCLIDSFAIQKNENINKRLDSIRVSKYINAIPDAPCTDNTVRINRGLKMYDSLDYFEKINVENYPKLLKSAEMNQSYKNILSGEIRVVKNKREFCKAVKDLKVSTIITACDEIKFENQFSFKDKIIINRDLCIRGSAKLLHARFILLKGAYLVLAGDVCVDNTRRPLSLYRAKDAFEMHDDAVLVFNDNVTVNSGYGTGTKGRGINVMGDNCLVYLNSFGQSFVNKGVVFSSGPNSSVIVNSGKYLSSGGNYALNVNGNLKINGGFIRNVKGYYESNITVSGGTIGEDNKPYFPVPVESFGKVTVCGGTVQARSGVSVLIRKNCGSFVRDEKSGFFVDIKGEIVYN